MPQKYLNAPIVGNPLDIQPPDPTAEAAAISPADYAAALEAQRRFQQLHAVPEGYAVSYETEVSFAPVQDPVAKKKQDEAKRKQEYERRIDDLIDKLESDSVQEREDAHEALQNELTTKNKDLKAVKDKIMRQLERTTDAEQRARLARLRDTYKENTKGERTNWRRAKLLGKMEPFKDKKHLDDLFESEWGDSLEKLKRLGKELKSPEAEKANRAGDDIQKIQEEYPGLAGKWAAEKYGTAKDRGEKSMLKLLSRKYRRAKGAKEGAQLVKQLPDQPTGEQIYEQLDKIDKILESLKDGRMELPGAGDAEHRVRLLRLEKLVKERKAAGKTESAGAKEDAKDFGKLLKQYMLSLRGQSSTGHPLTKAEKAAAAKAAKSFESLGRSQMASDSEFEKRFRRWEQERGE